MFRDPHPSVTRTTTHNHLCIQDCLHSGGLSRGTPSIFPPCPPGDDPAFVAWATPFAFFCVACNALLPPAQLFRALSLARRSWSMIQSGLSYEIFKSMLPPSYTVRTLDRWRAIPARISAGTLKTLKYFLFKVRITSSCFSSLTLRL